MFAHKEISHQVRRPTRSQNARHLLVLVYRERCVHIFMRFEHILHNVGADFAPGKLLIFRHYTMPCAHQSKYRAFVGVQRLRIHNEDLTAICDQTKKRKKPEFQLGRFPWKARVIIFRRARPGSRDYVTCLSPAAIAFGGISERLRLASIPQTFVILLSVCWKGNKLHQSEQAALKWLTGQRNF